LTKGKLEKKYKEINEWAQVIFNNSK